MSSPTGSNFLTPYLKQIFNIMLLRLQSSKTSKYMNGFMKFLATLVCSVKSVNASEMCVECLESIQPK